MAEQIWLDPAAVSDATREALEITSWVRVEGIDYGDAAISAYMSDGAVGSTPVDHRIPNRTIVIPLSLRAVGSTSFATIRSSISAKVGLFQRDGGWFSRIVDGEPLYADVVNATLHLGGSWLQAFKDADIDAVLTLECLPELYGDWIECDTLTGSNGQITAVIKDGGVDAVIEGDSLARAKIVVTDTSNSDQHGLLWGVRSRYFGTATTEALSYAAESLTALDAAAGTALTGAVGGSAMVHPALPANAWCPVLSTGALTHHGSYRVWARMYAGTTVPEVRFMWSLGDLSNPVENDPVRPSGTALFYLCDLGSIHIQSANAGTHQWQGVIQARTDVQDAQIAIDQLYFQPLDEGSGRCMAVQRDSVLGINYSKNAGTVSNDSTIGTQDWTLDQSIPRARLSYGGAATTHLAKFGNYGFAIPTGGTISGIKVGMWVISHSTGAPTTTTRVSLVKGGTVQTTNRASGGIGWPAGWTLWEWGGVVDWWGTTWTPAEINDPGFGVAIGANLYEASLEAAWAPITVYYTTSGGFTTVDDAVVFGNQDAELRTDAMVRESPGGEYGRISEVIDALPRLPPSGLEETPVELFLRLSRGDLDSEADSGLGTVQAVTSYRPVYLFTP